MALAPAVTTATSEFGKLGHVGGDIEGFFGSAVDAADAAGGKDMNAGHCGKAHGGGDGRGAIQLAGDDEGQIAGRDFADVAALAAEIFEFIGRQVQSSFRRR